MRLTKELVLTTLAFAAMASGCAPQVRTIDAHTFDLKGNGTSLDLDCANNIFTLIINGGGLITAGISDPSLAIDNPNRTQYAGPGDTVSVKRKNFSIDLTNEDDSNSEEVHALVSMQGCEIRQ